TQVSKEKKLATFDNIKKVDKEIEAFLKLDEERALEKARKIDERGVKADSILDGIGIGIKDNIVTKDLTTTAASKMLENFEPILVVIYYYFSAILMLTGYSIP